MLLIVLGLTGLGTAVKFIPRPVIVGFTNGIALLIAIDPDQRFFRPATSAVPSEFVERMRVLARYARTVPWPRRSRPARSLAIILAGPRSPAAFPGSIVALLLATRWRWRFSPCRSRPSARSFGGIPGGLPQFQFPRFGPTDSSAAARPALTVALLARSRACCRRWSPTA